MKIVEKLLKIKKAMNKFMTFVFNGLNVETPTCDFIK